MLATSATLLAVVLAAPARLPIEGDKDPGWQARPSFLGNPAAAPSITVADGVVRLSVSEPGRGMKFELPLAGLHADRIDYLVIRYRAAGLAGGYALWVMDALPGGRQVLATDDLKQDGEWHTLAVDLFAAGVEGSVRAVLTEVQCREEPAWIDFDWWRAADDIPAHADVHPPGGRPAADTEQVLRFAQLGELTPHRDWLSSPADQYGAEPQDGALHLFAFGAGRGMKWSTPLPEPLDLSPYRFVAFRYRAEGLAPWGDYAVYLGSAAGGQPPESVQPLRLQQLDADGRWHVAVVPLATRFTARDLAVQVSSAGARGDLWLESLRFCARRPRLAVADLLAIETGWDRARVASPRSVELGVEATTNPVASLGAFGLSDWLPPGRITVEGIPFELPREPAAIGTPEDIDAMASVPIRRRASEIYVLMASRLPDEDAARMGDPVPMTRLTNPERFCFEVDYEDGVVDQFFPVDVSSRRYEVSGGPAVYVLTDLRPVTIERLRLRNRMDSAYPMVAAVTLNQGEPVTARPAVLGLPPAAPASPELTRREPPQNRPGVLAFNDGRLGAELDVATTTGFALSGLSLLLGEDRLLSFTPGPVFSIRSGEKTITSADVRLGSYRWEADGTRLVLPFTSLDPDVPVAGELTIESDAELGLVLRLAVRNVGDRPFAPHVVFPILADLRVGDVEDTWYLYTRKGGVIGNLPIAQRMAYGGEHPLQVDGVFHPTAGVGLAMLTLDTDAIYRHHVIHKDGEGVDLQVEYWPVEVPPGGLVETVPTALRAHTGDWRRALQIYAAWTRSWYRPLVPRKDWFRRVFYYQQALAWGELREPGNGRWRMRETIAKYRDFHGCLDYLHIFDFGQSQVYGRVGDYSHYDELGGLEAMREAIAEAKAAGVPIGLYIEGYLCDDRGVWGREHVSRYDIRRRDGEPLLWPGAPHEHMMCPATDGWRRHLAETYARVAAELQPSGMYIDQYGFADTWKTCWSRDHGHPVPYAPLRGERDTTRAIREAVPPDIATLTEEVPCDATTQYQDGALGYSVTYSDQRLAPHRVELLRFVFPSFKVFQLVSYNRFVEGGWHLLKWPFFNGEGYWLHHGTEDSFCPDARRFLAAALRVLHEHADAFCSEDVEPLVPTLVPTVYANRFSGERETVWTLYNADYRTVRGGLLRVAHVAGTSYRDAFTGARLEPRVVGDQAEIAVELEPWGIGCVVAERSTP